MGIRPTELPVTPPRDGEMVRRVEPKSEAQEFGQEEKPSREGGSRRSDEEPVVPQDCVEISTAFPLPTDADGTSRADAADAPASRLDIEA